MNLRYVLVAVLLFFSWKGAEINFDWPMPTLHASPVPKPDEEHLAWAKPARELVGGMLPSDRIYLANLYEAMTFVLARDFERNEPIIAATGDFVNFHTASLRLAIEKGKVGKYPGLDAAIDQTFMSALGADQQKLDETMQKKLLAATGALSYVFQIGKDE